MNEWKDMSILIASLRDSLLACTWAIICVIGKEEISYCVIALERKESIWLDSQKKYRTQHSYWIE